MNKKRSLELFVTGVVVFDAVGYHANHFPVWPFVPMWVGAMLEVEVGAFLLAWLARLLPHALRSHLHW